MQETHGQYWRIGMYDLGCETKIFYIDLTVKKGNLSYYKEVITFIIAYYFTLITFRIPFNISYFWKQPLKITL